MSRWAHWSRGTEEKSKSLSSFLKEEPVSTGNPSAVMGPAERARSLGLQSNGKGGYIDPNTGQVVARTVNNELVFYDSNRASGGAISDGSGGAALTQAQPSWADPLTGMLTTPPSKAETPSEIAAIPDPTPATAPFGYNAFMKQKKLAAYQQNAVEPQERRMTPDEIEQKDTEEQSALSMEDYTPGDLLNKLGDGQPQTLAANVAKARAQQAQAQPTAPQVQQKNTQTPAQPSVVQPSLGVGKNINPNTKINQPAEDERRQKLIGALKNLTSTPEKKRGAGVNALSDDDISKFIHYVNNGSQVERVPVSDEEMEFANTWLKDNLGKKWNSLQNRMKGKGDPAPERKVVARAQEVLRSYLENLGLSSIDGEPLSFSESELDHAVSLDNGGEDIGDNWAWLPKRYNQFKGALDDETLLAKLQKLRERDPADLNLKNQEQALINRMRGDFKQRFADKGWDDINQADILEKKGSQGMQFLKALAEAAGVSYYKDRGVTRASGRAGGGTSLSVGELQQRLIDQLNIPSKTDILDADKGLFDVLQAIEDNRSEVDSAKRARRKEKREAKTKQIKEMVESYMKKGMTFEDLVEQVESALNK